MHHTLPFVTGRPGPVFCSVIACALLSLLLTWPASANADAEPRIDARPDPVAGIVRRMDRYLQHNEVDGVTMDWRYEVSPSEEIRQTVVCQVLAYTELYRVRPWPRLRRNIVERADFLLGRLEEIRSHSPFDGMLAYCLLAAYEASGEARFLAAGSAMTEELLAIPTSECVLNGGLMVAMATAEYARIKGDAGAEQKTRDIVAGLLPYQNEDGSFPHWCGGSRDIHYTGWMAMELIHIERMLDEPLIAPMLDRMTQFLARRIGPDGSAIYQEPCPNVPGCTNFYYSRASGCWYDYDTRGWTVEPAYCALAFEHAGAPEYGRVVAFLDSLEDGGTFSDLYGYWPPPEDPEYPWTIADTSVVNMSVIFWVLTTQLTDRVRRGESIELALEDEETRPPAGGRVPGIRLTIGPNPVRGACTLSMALAEASDVSLAIFDARGRCVMRFERKRQAAGVHDVIWDGRDLAGRDVPSGVYFARVLAGGNEGRDRFVLVR